MSNYKLNRWPDEQLEVVLHCPVCNSARSSELESDLIDWFANPPTGLWKLENCTECGVAFLSPRPNSQFLKEAYSHYYTHTSDKDDLVHGVLRSIKDNFAEKYYAVKSKSAAPTDYLMYFIVLILFPVARYFDAKSRHIFEVNTKSKKLLDIGCGNGEFLKFANRFGWDVIGLDFDEAAVLEAGSEGLDVRHGSIDVIDENDKFDFISLSHVIEHVYDPVEFIHSCFSRLNEGGTLWLETPNINSMGYKIYRSNWRGLEPPRHLVLFSNESLSDILLKAGFISVDQKLHGLSGLYMGLVSERILNTSSPCESLFCSVTRKMAKVFRVIFLEVTQLLLKQRREFITLVAKR